ncbi:MAG: hypothetical protein QM487_08955 [Candidatus Marithrix sp.]
MKEQTLHKLNNYIIICIFCALIFIPFTSGIIKQDKEISAIEKRTLIQLPEIPKTMEEINKFPQLFDKYYADHFGLRDWFTKYYKLVKYSIGDSPSEDVTIGKNGWLFLGSAKKGYNKYHDPMGDVRNVNLFSQLELNRLATYMVNVKNWLNNRGIEYLFIIAPNKHTIYFEQLPDYITKVNEKSATDQLVDYLHEHTDVIIVDLRQPLLELKNKHQIYIKTDTHWNHYAANVAQYQIMLEIEKLFPDKIQPELNKLLSATINGGDLAAFIGVDIFTQSFPEPVFEETCELIIYPVDTNQVMDHTVTCDSQKLNTVIFKDSFFNALEVYFARKFNRSTYIQKPLNYSSLVKYIKLEKPDIVIEELVERGLPYIPSETEFNHYIAD